MVELPASLAGLNKAAVAAAKDGRHEEALQLYQKLFQEIKERHLSHSQLFITHSNKAASHLALGQYTSALQDAKQCLELLTSTAASIGLFTPSSHPHWPKACLRLGHAFAGLGQHQQAAAAFEAGLAADPLNTALKSGLQQAQQGLAADLLSGKTLAHVKALPAPAMPERITLTPRNAKGVRASADSISSSSGRVQRRGYAVGWQGAGDAAAALLAAAETVQSAAAAAAAEAEGGDATALSSLRAAAGATGSHAAGSYQLPKLLLTPAAAEADVGLRDVYEYLSTQCAIRAPKQYLYRTLPDTPRMSAWWAATTEAVQAVHDACRTPRVLLLGAKAGVLAVAALRAGAAHVTCVDSSPYLAAACAQVLQKNGFPASSFTVICTPSPSTLKIGPTAGTDVPNVCNCLIVDMIDDGVLSGGLIPAVAHSLEDLLVRDEPVLVPQRLTVVAQAVGVRPSVVEIEGVWDSGSSDGSGGGCCSNGKYTLDLTAMDAYRWTPSQAIPSPLDPDTFIPLSEPKPVWDMPLADVVADRSAVQHMDMQLTTQGTWCAVAFWADLDLFDNITYTTAGPWASAKTAASMGSSTAQPSLTAHSSSSSDNGTTYSSSMQQAGRTGTDREVPVTAPATPLLLTYPAWDCTAQDAPATDSVSGHTSTAPAPAAASTPTAAPAKPAVSKSSAASAPMPVFQAPPSQQPAICWLPGGLPVSEGNIYPLVASHNTVRCMFTIQEADYSFLFHREPSFPHSHFAMISDTQRLQAYAAALRKALDRAAATKQQQQQQGLHAAAALASASGTQQAHGAWSSIIGTGGSGLTVLDLGCGSGVLSLLAAAALSAPMHAHCSPTCEGTAATTADSTSEALGKLAVQATDSKHRVSPSTGQPPTGSTPVVAAPGAADSTPPNAPRGSVIGVELTAPLAGVAQRAAAANGAAEVISIVQADVGSCRRCQQVPIDGADVIVLDMFDSELVGLGVLGLVEMAKATLAAEGAQIIPASASLYCMGVEVLTVSSWDGMQQQQQQQNAQGAAQQQVEVNLHALEAYKWSDEPDTVLLHHLPHKPLTAPAKLADFDFCAPAGTPYPKEMEARLDVVGEGKMNVVVVWFDLHLAEGVSITSAPKGYTTSGRACSSSNQHHHHHWGQSLHYLDVIPSVQPGDTIHLGALREGPKLSFGIIDAARPSSSPHSPCNSITDTINSPQQHLLDEQDSSAVPLQPASRSPWLRPGAGIEDPAVWSVKKCQQLLGQMLMRAPGAKFPPIWQDLELMQVHAGSLGLCAATVGAVTQELTMREALAVASQKQLTVSAFALPEAAGIQPPVVWR